MPRGNSQLIEISRGNVLNAGNVQGFSKDFPIAEPVRAIWLRFNFTIVIGTGAGAIAEGELKIIKAIKFKTDKGETIVNNVPGRLLFWNDQIKEGAIAVKDAITASSATFRVFLPIWFEDPLMLRPADFVLDTSRYNSMTLEVSLGTLADLYTAPGTATLATTLDIYFERYKGIIDPKVKPLFYKDYGIVQGAIDPNSAALLFDFEKADNLAYQRLFLYQSGGTGLVAGVPFSGTAVATVIDTIQMEDDKDFHIKDVLFDVLNKHNKSMYKLETAISGLAIIDLCKAGSFAEALYSGDKSRLRVKFNNLAGLPNPAQVTLGYEGYRPIAR